MLCPNSRLFPKPSCRNSAKPVSYTHLDVYKRQVVNYAPEKGSVEIREIPKPTIGEDEVLLEVANVGVCGSDLHQWTADHSWPVNYPVVLGLSLIHI